MAETQISGLFVKKQDKYLIEALNISAFWNYVTVMRLVLYNIFHTSEKCHPKCFDLLYPKI